VARSVEEGQLSHVIVTKATKCREPRVRKCALSEAGGVIIVAADAL